MRQILMVLAGMAVLLGCARVQVEAPKQPIKVDVTMRLDVYQHVAQDINAVEDMVSGTAPQSQALGKQSALWNVLIPSAYAQEGLGPEVEQAVARRRARRPDLSALLTKGAVGENKFGLVEIRNAKEDSPLVEEIVKAENNDRMIIYQIIAQKNGSSLLEVQKLYAQKLQQKVSQGTPIEVDVGGTYQWETKK